MIWWLALEKKTFQFWREIWIQVVVILLQLYDKNIIGREKQTKCNVQKMYPFKIISKYNCSAISPLLFFFSDFLLERSYLL